LERPWLRFRALLSLAGSLAALLLLVEAIATRMGARNALLVTQHRGKRKERGPVRQVGSRVRTKETSSPLETEVTHPRRQSTGCANRTPERCGQLQYQIG
jgi:hypothetical protein